MYYSGWAFNGPIFILDTTTLNMVIFTTPVVANFVMYLEPNKL